MIRFEKTVHFGRGSRTERQLREGAEPPPGRIPRILRLIALAIHYDELLRTGVVKSLAELAELGHVSTTRISHIMNLLQLLSKFPLTWQNPMGAYGFVGGNLRSG